jgi:hypothetical protein
MFSSASGALEPTLNAGVAQLVEQLIRNQQVIGSSPIAGSRITSKPNEFQDHGIV